MIPALLLLLWQPAYEVASIRPSNPTERMAIRRSGNRMEFVNYSLQALITWAYDIRDDRLLGKPKWLDAQHYDIAANGSADYHTPAGEHPTRLQQMMQTLLAERFKLAVHRETREMPMYVLVVDKNGPKVHVAPADAPAGLNPFSGSGKGRLVGTQVTAAMLANVLSSRLERTVEDQTKLDGVFDFTLAWSDEGPSIFTALQEQLGLKLESRKGPVEVLVIDRLESTPTEN